ncbi:MAG TPA: FHA domain-containing protein [Blastocatellia bacterium]|nr:FHA domain-containing protein [Blastocatellia bacterium]
MDQRCVKGHFFDPAKFSSCPHCGVPGLNLGPTMPHREQPENPLPMQIDDGRTRGVLDAKLGMNPVVGWLVCTDGPSRGRDFRIFSERNFIGRANTMNICIQGDDSISRERHAVVTYNPKKNTFSLSPGEANGLVYLNNEEVDRPLELNAYDRIQVGRTELLFIPFCGDRFQWLEPKKSMQRAN